MEKTGPAALVLAAGAIGRELGRRQRIERELAVSASAVDAVSSGIVVVDADGDGRHLDDLGGVLAHHVSPQHRAARLFDDDPVEARADR